MLAGALCADASLKVPTGNMLVGEVGYSKEITASKPVRGMLCRMFVKHQSEQHEACPVRVLGGNPPDS